MTSSNDQPSWWNQRLQDECLFLAHHALPNEAFGFICLRGTDSDPELVTLPGYANETTFEADGIAVVHFAYQLLAANGIVLASFHSHPNGQTWLSRRDQILFEWAHIHILLARSDDSFVFTFHSSSSDTQHIIL